MAAPKKQDINRFFNDVSSRCQYNNLENTKDVYYAIVRTVIEDIRKNEKALLPYIGELGVSESSQMQYDFVTETKKPFSFKRITFTAVTQLKKLINRK